MGKLLEVSFCAIFLTFSYREANEEIVKVALSGRMRSDSGKVTRNRLIFLNNINLMKIVK